MIRSITLTQPWATLICPYPRIAPVKWIETRSWQTSWRGPVLIHAAKTPLRERITFTETVEAWPADHPDRPHPNHPDGRPARLYPFTGWNVASWVPLPYGAVVGTAELVDCVPIYGLDDKPGSGVTHYITECTHDGNLPHQQGGLWLIGSGKPNNGSPTRIEDQRPYGDYTPGRYGWLLTDIRTLSVPVPARGYQRLWTPPDDVVAAVDAQLAGGDR